MENWDLDIDFELWNLFVDEMEVFEIVDIINNE